MNAGWTEERVELLKRLHGESLSVSQIALRLGGITRNAVIGKIHRLGLSVPKPPDKIRHKNAPKGNKRRSLSFSPIELAAKNRRENAKVRAKRVEPEPEIDAELTDTLPEPTAPTRTIETLKEHDCRWPMGDPRAPGFGFCGAPKETGLPYCAAHARRAYSPRRDRRTAA